MAFANPLYAGVTSKFFDYLVENINSQFEDRCKTVEQRGLYAEEIEFEDVYEEIRVERKDDEQARRAT